MAHHLRHMPRMFMGEMVRPGAQTGEPFAPRSQAGSDGDVPMPRASRAAR